MLLQPEDRGTGLRFVATDAFENAEAILQCIAHEMDMRVVPIDDRAVHPNFIGFFHPLARSPIGRFPFHHCLAADRDRENAALVPARLDALRGGPGRIRTSNQTVMSGSTKSAQTTKIYRFFAPLALAEGAPTN